MFRKFGITKNTANDVCTVISKGYEVIM